MAKIKKVSKTSSRRKHPISYHKLQNTPIKKHAKNPLHSPREGLTVREHRKALQIYTKYYKEGINIGNALDMSLKIDKERSLKDLNAFYIRSMAKGIFVFTVKSSGKYTYNEWGVSKPQIAKEHQVNIQWVLDGTSEMSNEDIFLKAPIKFECGCGKHSFFYRYTWTIMKSSLGLQQHVFPKVKNKELKGLVCKHGIRVMQVIHGSAFQKTFKRYVENYKLGKGARVTEKDKASVAGTSFFS